MRKGPKGHANIRILQFMLSGIPLRYLTLELECEILVFMWSFGPLMIYDTSVSHDCVGSISCALWTLRSQGPSKYQESCY